VQGNLAARADAVLGPSVKVVGSQVSGPQLSGPQMSGLNFLGLKPHVLVNSTYSRH
jgi:hypothetical protein